MKKSLIFIFLLASSMMMAQKNFGTGDVELEKQLNTLNTDAKSNLTSFKDNISQELNLSKERIQELLDKALEPAEIILGGRISEIAKTDFETVMKSYEINKDKGWGQVAKDLGIKPGSPEFHALKGKSKGKPSGNPGNGNSKGKGKN